MSPFQLEIHNDGEAIASTNYWDSPHAEAGYVFLSRQGGAVRLLIPDQLASLPQDVGEPREVLISRGPYPDGGFDDAVEVLFEDDSNAPYMMIVPVQCTDYPPTVDEHGRVTQCTLWTREGCVGAYHAVLQTVPRLPYMALSI